MNRMIKRAQVKLARVGAKAKGVAVAGIATVCATASQAAVTVDPSTGAISGTLDMTSFYGGAAVAGTAVGIVSAVLLGIGILKKAR